MAGNRAYQASAYDFRTRDTYTPDSYSAGYKAAAKGRRNSAKKGTAALPVFLGAALTAAALVFSLLAQAKLTAVSNETVELYRRIEQLSDEQVRLKIEHTRAFGLEELEDYARNVLGMHRPTADQITYTETDSSEGDFPAGE